MSAPDPLYHRLAAWQDVYAVGDERIGSAYESLDGRERAVLKKCIARLYGIWGERVSDERRIRRFSEGFVLEEDETAASLAIIACPWNADSPAAFLAALMPALLAGVETVLPCFTVPDDAEKDAAVNPALLAALDLAGVEQAYAVSGAALVDLLDMLSPAAAGRFVLLAEPGTCGEALQTALTAGLRSVCLALPPRFFSVRQSAVFEQRFQQAERDEAARADDEHCDDIVFLSLDAEHEDVWVWPELDPGWFRTRRMKLSSFRE